MTRSRRLFVVLVSMPVCWAVLFAFSMHVWWTVGGDTDRMMTWACYSGDADGTVRYLVKYRDGLEKYGLTSGNYGVFKQDASSSFEEHTRLVDGYIARAKAIQNMNPNGKEYREARRDLRDDMVKLPAMSLVVFWKRYWWACIVTCIVTVGALLMGVTFKQVY